jgi:hypothetical protein
VGVEALATLKPREREALYLQGLGYSYREIAQYLESSGVDAACHAALTTCRRGGRRLGYRPWAARQGLEAVAGVPAASTICADARLGDANESSASSGTRP